MATVSEVAIRYAAKGAQRAQKADRRVRDSIQRTAKVARKEEGTIRRWMSRHKAALTGIAAATAGAMAAIIKSSPALSAQLSSVRLGFSLLAMTIGNDVAPATDGLGDKVIGLSDAYAELPDPVRTVISYTAMLLGLLAGLAAAAAVVETVIGGTLVASFLSWVASAISLSAIMYKLGAAVAVVEFVLGALAAALGISVGAAAALVVAIAAIIGIIVAYIFNIGGARDAINGWLADTKAFVAGVIKYLGQLGSKGIAKIRGYADDAAKWFGSAKDRAVAKARELKEEGIAKARELKEGGVRWLKTLATDGGTEAGKFASNVLSAATGLKNDAIERAEELYDGTKAELTALASDSYTWGKDLMSNFGDGIVSKAKAVRDRVDNVMDGIKSKISFDRVQNDRMARRWGSDLMDHFSRGIERKRDLVQGSLPSPIAPGRGRGPEPAPTTGSSGGQNITVIIEQGAIQLRGGSTAGMNADRTGSAVANELGSIFDGRR